MAYVYQRANDNESHSMISLQTQAEDIESIKPQQQDMTEVEQLLLMRASLKDQMKDEIKSDCNGKEEYISFDNHPNLLDLAHYKQFIWPTCNKGLSLNLLMHETCKKLWKLNYRDYQNYLEVTYIFI